MNDNIPQQNPAVKRLPYFLRPRKRAKRLWTRSLSNPNTQLCYYIIGNVISHEATNGMLLNNS